MASIEKRTDGKWRARWREVPGGPQKTRHFERKIDAQRFLDGIVGDLARGTYVDPSAGRETFGEYARAWAARQVHRPSTAALVESHLRRHVLPAFESKPLADVRRSDVQAWVKSKDGPLAPATLRVAYSFVAAIFQSAVEDRVLSASPCIRITLPKVTKKRVQPLPVEGVEAIVEAMPDRLQAAVLLAAATGLRQGEALGLTIDRVDWLRRTVTIDAAVGQLLTPDRGQPRLGPPKTASSARVVPLPQVAVDALAAHVAAFPVTHPWGLLFTT